MLIYPRWEGAGTATVRVRNSPVEIERFAIDLAGSIADIQSETVLLASRLRFLAGESTHALPNKLLTLR